MSEPQNSFRITFSRHSQRSKAHVVDSHVGTAAQSCVTRAEATRGWFVVICEKVRLCWLLST